MMIMLFFFFYSYLIHMQTNNFKKIIINIYQKCSLIYNINNCKSYREFLSICSGVFLENAAGEAQFVHSGW